MISNRETRRLFFAWQILILPLLIITNPLAAQTDLPFARDLKIYNSLQVEDLSKISSARKEINESDFPEDIAGQVLQVDFTTKNSGQWKQFSDRYDTWILKISIKDVAGIALVFSRLKFDNEAKLFVCSAEEVKGPFHKSDIPPSGILAVGYIRGTDLVIELDMPVHKRSSFLDLSAISFTDNEGLVGQSSMSSENKRSENCYTCITGKRWERPKNAVVKIITFRESEAIMCTGTLVNNTALDAKPYILTAQHCISDQADADNSIFLFGDNDLNCDGSVFSQRSAFSGAMLRAASFENDFSLVELHERVSLGSHPWFAGWDISDNNVAEVSCIHHPLGGAKKISLQHQRLEISDFLEEGKPLRAPHSFWHIQEWDTGTTEGGSSGAPLFNHDQKIIGTLSGGASTCASPYNDYFEMLSVSWDQASDAAHQLKHWLDPISSGKKILNGFDPFDGIQVLCDTVSNIGSNEATTLMPDPSGDGFLSGCNSDSISSFAETFEVEESKLTGLQIFVGSINPEVAGGIYFSILNDHNGLPGEELAQIYIPYKKMHLYFNYIPFDPYVSVNGRIFVSYTMDCSSENLFALEMAPWRKSNTTYLKSGNQWHPMTDINPDGMGTSLYINLILCTSRAVADSVEEKMTIYPNPVSTQLVARLPENESEIISVQLYQSDGGVRPVAYNTYFNSMTIDVSTFASGPYLIRVTTNNKIFMARFIKL
jgi:lysyl endopeptidase